MILAKIQVTDIYAAAVYRKPIPAGIVGAQVQIEYADDIWASLRKTVVFRGAGTKDVITDDTMVTIPAEVVAQKSVRLKVGVYGVDADNNIVIPTLWADLGIIQDATDPSGDPTTDPGLPVWAQIQAMIGDLSKLDTTAKNNLVAAVNEALIKGGGTVDPADIQRIVDAYLAANPPAPGTDGGYYTPSVTQPDANTMTVSFTPSKEGMDSVPEKSIPLPAGPTGATPNIKIGTVETLEAGSPATASMTGTPENPILNLGIPQGAPGSGEGSSGIAVTGATVGQTVRIAAVDDNGVPTAWEPVDLPSGGADEWEMLGTLDASTADALQFDFPVPMKKIIFLLQISDSAGGEYAESTSAYRLVSLLTDSWLLLNNVKIGMISHYWKGKCFGYLMCENDFAWINITKSILTGSPTLQYVGFPITSNNANYKNGFVYGIKFSAVLPDDTDNTASGEIKVWGVRAHENQ